MVPSRLSDPMNGVVIRVEIAHTRLAVTNAMRNEPPPHSAATLMNLHTFPVPTAILIAAATKANLHPNTSLVRDHPQFIRVTPNAAFPIPASCWPPNKPEVASLFQPEVQVGGQLADVHLGLLETAGVVPVHGLPAGESSESLLLCDKYCAPLYLLCSLARLLFMCKARKDYQNMVKNCQQRDIVRRVS